MSQILVTGEAKIRDIQGPVVANSGVITALDGAASQYVRGDGTLADFPTSTGGGSSVSYYLNSSISQGTIGGVAYRQLGKTPIAGAGTDITASTNGYIASYLTDANDPALLEVPAGNFNCEFYFAVNSNNHDPYVYAEVYKYDGTTFTLIGSSQSVPEYLTNGTTLSPYYFAIPVTQTTLAITDRIAIRIYVNVDGRVVTLHTENNHLCQVVTTFSKGLTSLNNLTRQVQFLATGTSGTDFNISSSTATHTFNLPIASATNTGKLSSTDWSTFNNKQPAGNYVTLDTTQTITASKTFSNSINADAGIKLKDGFTAYSNGYTSLSGQVGNLVISGSISSTPYDNELAFTPLTSNLYTFPNASGTVALTSDISYPVTSVFGRTGAVVAVSGDYNTSQVTENTNLYFTDARSRAALSFTAGSGAYNSTTGVITIPTNNNQLTNGASFITLASLSAGTGITYNNTTGVITNSAPDQTVSLTQGAGISISGTYPSFTIASTITQYTDALARAAISLTTTGTSGAATYNSTTGVFNIPQYTDQYVGTVTSVGLSSATSGVTIGSTPITTSGTITLAIATASGSQNGLLSSTDWTTFNNKYNLPSLTSGSVLFSNGSTIAQDNANFFWDDTNNRLGIGTATPLYTLDVVKTGSNGIRVLNNDSGSEAAFVIVQNLTTAGLFGVNNAGPYLYTASTLDMQFYTSAIERMRIFSDGNILIGSSLTNAGYKLDVSGTGRFTGALSTTGGTRNIQMVSFAADWNYLRSNGANLVFGTQDANTLYIRTNDVDRLTIASTGAATFSSSIAATTALLSTSSSTTSQFRIENSSYAVGQTMGIDFTVAGGSKQAYVRAVVNNGTTAATDLVFGTASGGNNAATVLTLSSTGAATFSSSVTASGDITSRTSLNAYTLSNVEPYVFLARNSGSNGIGVIRTLDGGALAFDNGATGAAQSTKMTLSASGNLGLGVTPSAWTAGQAMQIGSLRGLSLFGGTAIAQIGNNVYYNGGYFYGANGTATLYTFDNGGHNWLIAPSGTAGNAISFTQAMTLFANGNLAVGTTTDAGYKLDVNGTGRFSDRLQLNSSTYAILDMYGANGYGNQIRFGDGTTLKAAIRQNYNVGEGLEFYSGGIALANLALYINTSGNVSIGNTNNTYKLDVNGTGRFSGMLTMSNSGNVVTNKEIIWGNTGGNYIGQYYDGTNLLFYNGTGGANLLSITRSSGAATFSSSVTATSFSATDIESGVYANYFGPYSGGSSSILNFLYGSSGSVTWNNGGVKMTLSSSGTLGITTLAGSGSRAVLADASGNLSAPVSDISVKQNITSIGYGLNEILKMNPVWFDFIDEYKNYGEGRQNGNIAQEMETIIPEAVFTTPSTGKMGINYDQMHAVYIKAIQELEARIKQLENK